MGYYKWSRVWHYSGELVQLDSTDVLSCVRSPLVRSKVSNPEDVNETVGDARVALAKTILEKYGRKAEDSDSGDRMLPATDRLTYIPRFGYFCVGSTPVSVQVKGGAEKSALVGMRFTSGRGKVSTFYLFSDSDDGIVFSGSIGRTKVTVFAVDSGSDRATMHFDMTSF